MHGGGCGVIEDCRVEAVFVLFIWEAPVIEFGGIWGSVDLCEDFRVSYVSNTFNKYVHLLVWAEALSIVGLISSLTVLYA